jgi:hypothetical protein
MTHQKRWHPANLRAIRAAIIHARITGNMAAGAGFTTHDVATLIPAAARATPYWRAFSRTLWAEYFRAKHPHLPKHLPARDSKLVHALTKGLPR